jgi:opacity protein-like surface antigen
MTAKKAAHVLIITMALCFSAIAGRAQDDKVFIMGGTSSLKDAQSFTELYIPFTSAYALGGKGIVGFEMPYRKSRIIGLEGSFAYGQNNLKLTNLNTNPITEKGYGLRTARISADIVLRSPSAYRGVYPYAVAGVEYDLFNPTGAAQTLATTQGFAFEPVAKLSSQGAIGANIGGGLEWEASSNIDLRLDVRDHFTTSPTFGLPTSQPSTAGLPWFPVTGNAQNIEISIGIVYHFHGRKQASTPATPATQSAPSTTTSSSPRRTPRPSSEPLPSSPPSPF